MVSFEGMLNLQGTGPTLRLRVPFPLIFSFRHMELLKRARALVILYIPVDRSKLGKSLTPVLICWDSPFPNTTMFVA